MRLRGGGRSPSGSLCRKPTLLGVMVKRLWFDAGVRRGQSHSLTPSSRGEEFRERMGEATRAVGNGLMASIPSLWGGLLRESEAAKV